MTKKRFLLGLSICIAIFIWHNSLQDAVNSEKASLFFVALVRRFILFVPVSFSTGILDHILRKLAHFTEFASLGCSLMALFLHLTKGRVRGSIGKVCLIGLAVAFVDEFLQLFSEGRSCQLADVGLDFFGVTVGLLVCCCLWKLNQKI